MVEDIRKEWIKDNMINRKPTPDDIDKANHFIQHKIIKAEIVSGFDVELVLTFDDGSIMEIYSSNGEYDDLSCIVKHLSRNGFIRNHWGDPPTTIYTISKVT